MNEKILQLIDKLISANMEKEIISLLVNSCEDTAFHRARYYDANYCPFDNKPFYVLHLSSHPYANAPKGYLIYDATLTQDHIMNKIPAWEKYNDESVLDSLAKSRWVNDLELHGSGWIDIPIVVGNNLLGMWALDRDAELVPSDEENKMLQRLAFIAGLKLIQLRQEHIIEQCQQMFNKDIDYINEEGAIKNYVEDIAKTVGAASMAYFRFDPVNQILKKSIEIVRQGDVFKINNEENIDSTYSLGECLTGNAFLNNKFEYVPDFKKLQAVKPNLANVGSVNMHQSLFNNKIVSVIYQKVDIPGTSSGILRAINRFDEPSLNFTKQHKALLEQVSRPFTQFLETLELTSILNAIWESFSNSLEHLRENVIDYKYITDSLRLIGFPIVVITIWGKDGNLSHVWSNEKSLVNTFSELIGSVISSNILNINEPEFIEPSDLPKDIAAIFNNANIQMVYVIPKEEKIPERRDPEYILTIIPVLIQKTLASKAIKLEVKKFWLQKLNLRRTLDLMGNLIGTIRELARNRNLLIYAEQAIGQIGHETRSPIQWLVSTVKDLSKKYSLNIRNWPSQSPVWINNLEVDANGSPYYKEIRGKDNILGWVNKKNQEIEQYTEHIHKLINDAIRWARFGGRTIEMDLKQIDVLQILNICISELKKQLIDKNKNYLHNPLKIVLGPSVYKLPTIVADPFMIHDLFINLLDNAIKYSHYGGDDHAFEIKIIAERQVNLIDIHITNWGLGINENDYNDIFSIFYRSAIRDRLHTVPGFGFGLSTCDRIVRLHKGFIKVKSIPTLSDKTRTKAMEGFQTTFTIRLPTTLKEGLVNINTNITT